MAEPQGFRKTGAGQQLGLIDPAAEAERRRQADAERQRQNGGGAPVAGDPLPSEDGTNTSLGGGQGGGR